MKSAEYNETRTESGTITWDDWVTLVRLYQLSEPGLAADGKLGPISLAALRGEDFPKNDINSRLEYTHSADYAKIMPLPPVKDKCGMWEIFPEVSSDHYLKNPSRAPGSRPGYKGHQGQDFMYRYNDNLHPPKREMSANRYDGSWWVPPGVMVRAVAPGKVVRAEHTRNKEWTVRLLHPDGWQTQYRHLESCHVRKGDEVKEGIDLGLCGGMNGVGLVHLHFEVYQPGPYIYTESMYPTPFLDEAVW